MSRSKASKPDSVWMVLTTLPSRSSAEKISRLLIQSRLVACAQVGQPIVSHYRWKSRTHKSREIPLSLKTRRRLYKRLEKQLLDLHPYKVPQIIAVSGQSAYRAYLKWVKSETQDKS
jgi:periplasmic divalent cation tolerance protein